MSGALILRSAAPLADAACTHVRAMRRVGTSSPAYDTREAQLLACLTELRKVELAYAEITTAAQAEMLADSTSAGGMQ